jgi:release factor glutamine methyltransferase
MDEVYEPREDSHLLEKYVKRLAKGSVLEIGIGSGIQTAAALARADSVLGVDINQKAIEFCKDKIKSEKARFLKSDLFSNVSGKFDTIIFNAPYLPDDEECKDVALDGGKQGHEIIGKFLAEAKNFLAKDGIILLVFSSFTNKNEVDRLISENNFRHEELERIHISFEDIYCYKISRV